MAWRSSIQWLALALAACGERGDDDRPLDGGYPLREPAASSSLKDVANRDCFRVERGRWHYSVGHCEAMLPPQEMAGIWVTAFEETSYFPGAAAIPDANDPARFTRQIELDERKVVRLSGHAPSNSNGEAYLLTFTGRRTRVPWFDCHGVPAFTFVIDRLTGARYLGSMGRVEHEGLLARYEAYAQRLRGRWGRAQAEAVERCKGDSADALEDAAANDQSPAQASPAGKGSAE